MLDLQLQYDPAISIDGNFVSEMTDVDQVIDMLMRERLPVNLVQTCVDHPNFMDAIINKALNTVTDSLHQRAIMELFAAAVASTPQEKESRIQVYTTLLAALSYSWGETTLATRAVLRAKPEFAGAILTSIATALTKQMDSNMFKSLLLNTTTNGANSWVLESLMI